MWCGVNQGAAGRAESRIGRARRGGVHPNPGAGREGSAGSGQVCCCDVLTERSGVVPSGGGQPQRGANARAPPWMTLGVMIDMGTPLLFAGLG